MRGSSVSAAIVVSALLGPLFASAAEMGRVPVSSGSASTRETQYGQAVGMGVEAAVEWNSAGTKIGSRNGTDQAICPALALFYNVSEALDLRLTTRWMSVRDEDTLETFRFGVGARYRFPVNSDFAPYVGAGLNYYALSLKDGSNEEGMLGVSGEAGVIWLVNEYVTIRLGAQAETSLMDGEAQREGDTGTKDVSLQAVGIGLGMAFVF